MSSQLFTKNFILMFLSNMLICGGFYMLMPIFPAYAIDDLGIDKSQVGFIIGIFSLSAVFCRPIIGSMLDNIGRMPIYIPSLVAFALCAGAYYLTSSVTMLIVVRILHGISWSGVSTANSTIVADIVPKNLRAQGIGLFGLSMTLSMALGSALGTFLMDYFVIKQIFIICMIISLTAFFSSMLIKLPKTQIEKRKITLKSLIEFRVVGISVIEFSMGFISAGILSYSALYAMRMGLSGIGNFFLIYAIAIAASRIFSGQMMDKSGPTVLLIAGMVTASSGCVLLGFATSKTLFLIAAGLAGAGAGLAYPTLMTMAMNVVQPYRRGAANATLFMAFDIGVGTGAMVLGVVAGKIGFSGMYLFSACIIVIPLLWYTLKERARYFRYVSEINEVGNTTGQ